MALVASLLCIIDSFLLRILALSSARTSPKIYLCIEKSLFLGTISLPSSPYLIWVLEYFFQFGKVFHILLLIFYYLVPPFGYL